MNNALATINLSTGSFVATVHEGEPVVILKRACEEMGLKAQDQKIKLQQRSWARVWQIRTQLPDQQQHREYDVIDKKTLIMWLAGINENKVKPEHKATVIAFQNEAADALDRYFSDGGALNPRVDFTDPDNLLKILTNWSEDKKKLEAAESKIQEDAPKVLLGERFIIADGETGIRESARILGVRQSELSGLLRDWGWMEIRTTEAKAYATQHGFMVNRGFIDDAGRQHLSGKLTRKGVERIARKLSIEVAA